MGYDDFDEDMPGDMDAEDFANFDPDRYRRKRNKSDLDSSGSDNSEQTPPPAEDFANFDPDAYLRKRRGQAGSSLAGRASPSTGSSYSGRGRRRSSVLDDSDEMPDAGESIGLGAGFLSALGSRDMPQTYGNLLREAGPLIKVGLLALGCGILAVLALGCVVGYLLVTAITGR